MKKAILRFLGVLLTISLFATEMEIIYVF